MFRSDWKAKPLGDALIPFPGEAMMSISSFERIAPFR